MSHKNLRTINTANRGPIEFNLNARKGDGKVAFIEEVLFFQSELPTDPEIIGEVAKIIRDEFVEGDWSRSPEAIRLKRNHLPEFRALPARILHAIEKNESVFESGTRIVQAMILAVESEFKSRRFWLEEGVGQLILRREEIEMIEQTLEVSLPHLSENDYIARHLAQETLRVMRQPAFVKFSQALPRQTLS